MLSGKKAETAYPVASKSEVMPKTIRIRLLWESVAGVPRLYVG